MNRARSPAGPEDRRRTATLLAVAVLAVSSSAVLVRWADAPAVSLAFWRTAAGALLLAPLARRSAPPSGAHAGGAHAGGGDADGDGEGRGRTGARRRWGVVAGAGVALGVHFCTWLASLELTSVAASVTLVSTAPAFVALYLVLTGRRPRRRVAAAIALALTGTAVIAAGDARSGGQSFGGDLLALVGAAAMAVYLVAGARARVTMGTAVYASRAYGVAALSVLPVVVLAGYPLLGFDAGTWLAIVGMVLGPQLAGHTLANHLLARVGPVTVSLALLLEPVGAAVLTWLAFGEVPPGPVWIGAPVVLSGLAIQAAGAGPRGPRRR